MAVGVVLIGGKMSGKGAKGLIMGKSFATAGAGALSNNNKDKDKKKLTSRSSRAGLQVHSS